MLERLHYRPIIASLKPENILVDYFGHVSLCRSHHALPLPRRRPEFHPPRSPRTRSPQSRTKNNEPPTRGDPRATNRPRQFHPSLGSRRGIAGLRHDAYAARQRRVLRFQGTRPSYPLYYDVCTLGEAPRLKVEDFPPPLVWAVRLGNPELTRLLLLGGADANVGYHGLSGRRGRQQQQQQYGHDGETSMRGSWFLCGRVVQLAMDMGYEDIVRLLIVVGALMSGDPIRFGICPVMRVRWCRGPCIWRSRLGSRLRLWMRRARGQR